MMLGFFLHNCFMTNCCSISTWVNKEDGVCQTRRL